MILIKRPYFVGVGDTFDMTGSFKPHSQRQRTPTDTGLTRPDILRLDTCDVPQRSTVTFQLGGNVRATMTPGVRT